MFFIFHFVFFFLTRNKDGPVRLIHCSVTITPNFPFILSSSSKLYRVSQTLAFSFFYSKRLQLPDTRPKRAARVHSRVKVKGKSKRWPHQTQDILCGFVFGFFSLIAHSLTLLWFYSLQEKKLLLLLFLLSFYLSFCTYRPADSGTMVCVCMLCSIFWVYISEDEKRKSKNKPKRKRSGKQKNISENETRKGRKKKNERKAKNFYTGFLGLFGFLGLLFPFLGRPHQTLRH